MKIVKKQVETGVPGGKPPKIAINNLLVQLWLDLTRRSWTCLLTKKYLTTWELCCESTMTQSYGTRKKQFFANWAVPWPNLMGRGTTRSEVKSQNCKSTKCNSNVWVKVLHSLIGMPSTSVSRTTCQTQTQPHWHAFVSQVSVPHDSLIDMPWVCQVNMFGKI